MSSTTSGRRKSRQESTGSKKRWHKVTSVSTKAALGLALLLLLIVEPAMASANIVEFPVPAQSRVDGIATGPDGNLWFTEIDANNIGKITTTGIITEYPLPIPASMPLAIAAGPDGNVWFTQGGTHSFIGKITPGGSVTEFPVPSIYANPVGIVAGPDGNLWFTEAGASNIGKITTAGVITEYPLPNRNFSPGGITVGPDGNIWFTEEVFNILLNNAGQIGKITVAGAITEYALPAPLSFAIGIAAGPDGNLWFTQGENNNDMIGRITTTGTITGYPLSPLSIPGGITTGPDGNLWFTQQDSNMIDKITTAGALTEYSVPTPASQPLSITAGPDGNIWFTEAVGEKISVLVLSAPTSTTISCNQPSVAVSQATQCTASITDTSIAPTTPTGTVTFTSGTAGSFSPSTTCTLLATGASTSSCSVNFTPSPGTEGTPLITGSYDGDPSHKSSSGSFSLTVTMRTTSNSVSCSPSFINPAHPAICVATIKDTSIGTPITPTGTVIWTTTGTGTFSQTSCVSPLAGTLSCTVTYSATPGRAGFHTISATYNGDTDHFSSSDSTTIAVA